MKQQRTNESLPPEVAAPESATPGPARKKERWGIRLAIWVIVSGLTWLSIIYMPHDVLSPALDRSYQGALSYFAEKQMQFGPEVIFTYGPLGYLVPEIYDGTFFSRKLIFELLTKLFIVLVLVSIARELPYLNRVLFFCFIWILAPRFGHLYPEVLFYISIAAIGVILSRQDRWRNYFGALALAFLAVVSLIKFTLFIYSLFLVILLSVHWGLRRNWKACLLIPTIYGALILLAWSVAGQKWVNIPTWIFNSLQIASGYQQCMGLDPKDGILLLASAVAATAMCLFGTSLFQLRKNLLACLPLLGLVAGYWVSWKHGLIRADDHVVLFFGFSLLGFVSFPAFLKEAGRVRTRHVLSGLGCILSLAGIYLQKPAFLTEMPTYTVSHFFETTRDLISLKSYQAKLEELLSAEKKLCECPRIKTVVGTATVDVFGHNQGLALLNDLNYYPRPVFQSYSTYTPYLIRTNADFYRSERAPSYVMMSLQWVDGRFPTQDDSEALQVLLRDYDLVLSEANWLLWKKPALRRTIPQDEAGSEMEVSFGQTIPLSEAYLWSVIDIKETALGKLRSFFYKPPVVYIVVTDEKDNRVTYRLLPSSARAGFILNPYLHTQSNLIGLKTKFAPEPAYLSSFELMVDDSSRKYFVTHPSVHLFRSAPLVRD